jgi:hypothetical protein
MVEIKPGIPASSLLEQVNRMRTEISNGRSAHNWEDGQRYFLNGVESLEQFFSYQFLDESWNEHLYSNGYWAIRAMSEATPRPIPLLTSEANRLVRWLDEIERELRRINEQDEWESDQASRIIFDTSALVREGSFDTFDWLTFANATAVRLIIPVLVTRELDDLKNYAKSPKARPRLRKIRGYLDGHGRGPVTVRPNVTLELLMDPPGHARLAVNDEEIIRRSRYLHGRKGGPLKLVTGDYTMLFTAPTYGIDTAMTPAELKVPDTDGNES